MEYRQRLFDKFSVEQVKIELLNTAYGNDQTFLAKLDPRTLFIWYLFFGFAPWFIHNEAILLGMFVFVTIMMFVAMSSPLIIFILCLGLLGLVVYLFSASWFFGGGL